MSPLEELVIYTRTLEIPQRWLNCRESLAMEHALSQSTLGGENRVYGAETLPGHRDLENPVESSPAEVLSEVLASHAIGLGEVFEPNEARAIGGARIMTWCAGKTGVSPSLFDAACRAATDPNFSPSIPKRASYSCGDVIPAAHWARALLDHVDHNKSCPAVRQPSPLDAMSLINGSFIQLGYASQLAVKARWAWEVFVECSALTFSACNCSCLSLSTFKSRFSGPTSTAIERVRLYSRNQSPEESQAPVSLRGLPETLDSLSITLDEFLTEVDRLLLFPTGNPLFVADPPRAVSQASFLQPRLTIRAGSLTEALLLCTWSIASRMSHLLGGKVDGIPIDGSTPEARLGLIQHPKLATAILEDARIRCGRRLFSSGGQTSYGIEDLWSNGLSALEQLEVALSGLLRACAVELDALSFLRTNSNEICGSGSPLLEESFPLRSPQIIMESLERPSRRAQLVEFPKYRLC